MLQSGLRGCMVKTVGNLTELSPASMNNGQIILFYLFLT